MDNRMVKDCIRPDEDARLVKKHKCDVICTWYGIDVYKLTLEDILSLLQGYALYGDENMEYAQLIYLER